MAVFVGALWRHYFLFPFPQLKRLKTSWSSAAPLPGPPPDNVIITKYKAGVPLYSDRNYVDYLGDARLDGLILVQISRHRTEDIHLKSEHPVQVFRLLTRKNDNKMFSSWDPVPIKVKVLGYSCALTWVVSKSFPKGLISLKAGGPRAASPILLKLQGVETPIMGIEVHEDPD